STVRSTAGCSASRCSSRHRADKPDRPAFDSGAGQGGAPQTVRLYGKAPQRGNAPESNAGAGSDDVEVLGAPTQVLGRALAVELDVQAQVVDRIRVAQRILVADISCLVEIEQRLVEGLHPELAAFLHDLLDRPDFPLE